MLIITIIKIITIIFDEITSIKSMESMECMYEKVSLYLTAFRVTLCHVLYP